MAVLALTEKQKKLIETNKNLLFSYIQKKQRCHSIPSFLEDSFESDINWHFCLSALKYDEELGYKFSTYAYGGFHICFQKLYVEEQKFIKNHYLDSRTIKFLVEQQRAIMHYEKQPLNKNTILSLLNDTNFNSKEKLVLITYFFENLTARETAILLKLTTSRIQQVLKAIKNKLRKTIVRKKIYYEDFYI